jgi:2-keto-3-deoxy-L-rhamnonate aldolase RhmA
MKDIKTFTKPLIGTLFTSGSNQVAEIISNSGFDWVMVDMEHSTLSLENVQTTLQVMGKNIISIVRVPGNDSIWIKRVLDTGCDGILIPMVKDAEEARRAIVSAKYPTMGERSVGVTRAHKFGAGFNEYVTGSNEQIIIMIQIEHFESVKNLDTILKVAGIDVIFIGPYDLSASMGLLGKVDHPDVIAAINTVKNKCKAAGMPFGIFRITPEHVEDEITSGCAFPLCGIDISIISGAYNDLVGKMKKDRIS